MQYLYAAQLILMIVMPLVRMMLRFLDVGFVTYMGVNLLVDTAKDFITSKISASSVEIQMILGLGNVDIAINICMAAVVTRAILSGWDKRTDRKRKQVWNKPSGTSIEA